MAREREFGWKGEWRKYRRKGEGNRNQQTEGKLVRLEVGCRWGAGPGLWTRGVRKYKERAQKSSKNMKAKCTTLSICAVDSIQYYQVNRCASAIAAPWRQNDIKTGGKDRKHKKRLEGQISQLKLLCQLISSSLPGKFFLSLTASFAF